MFYYFLLAPADPSHKLNTSPITTGTNTEHSSFGCRVSCEEYVYKWHNAVITTRFVWNIIKVNLNMFVRFLCCYLNENSFVFCHIQLLLPLLELLRSTTTLKINLYITLWASFGFFFLYISIYMPNIIMYQIVLVEFLLAEMIPHDNKKWNLKIFPFLISPSMKKINMIHHMIQKKG